MGTLTGLQDLLLGVMGLSGTIPPSLGSLTALLQLGLHLNQLNGTIPSALGTLGQLSLLWIYGNQLSGSLPPTFCTNAALKSCIVFAPTGGQSANFSSCVAPTCRAALDYCGMPACPRLHCAARNSLRVCSALSDLYFSTAGSGWTMNTGWLAAASLGSDVTGDGVDLCSFYGVSCNSTTGVLTALNLASNNLAGTLPLSISTLTSLSSLVLSQNRLTGAIPSTMGSLTAASILSLWGNQLSGPLPDSLSTLGSLILLDVSNNSLSGPVPPSFCTLASTLGFGPFGSGCVLARARDSNTFACPLPCPSLLAGGCSVLTCVNPPVPAPVPDLRKRNLEIALPIALFFALVSFVGLRHLVVKRRLSRPTASCLDTVSHVFRLLFNALCCIPEEPLYDVFISYRREDMHIVDTIADKLLLAGFRVSMDRLGSLVGDGVDNSIFEAISQSRVFLPVISTALLRSLVKGDDSYWQQKKDYVLLEIVAAQLLLRSPASARNRLHMIYPVVLGSESRDASNVLQWENFFKDPQFKAMAAQLPQVEPVATVAALKALFQTIGLEPLAGGGEGLGRQLTVRDALYGSRSAGAAVDGLLALDCYILQGSSANVDAKIRLELAENIRKGMNKRRGPSAAHGLAPAAAKEGGDGGGGGGQHEHERGGAMIERGEEDTMCGQPHRVTLLSSSCLLQLEAHRVGRPQRPLPEPRPREAEGDDGSQDGVGGV